MVFLRAAQTSIPVISPNAVGAAVRNSPTRTVFFQLLTTRSHSCVPAKSVGGSRGPAEGRPVTVVWQRDGGERACSVAPQAAKTGITPV